MKIEVKKQHFRNIKLEGTVLISDFRDKPAIFLKFLVQEINLQPLTNI